MLSAHLCLSCTKSRAYYDSLCKHFARKVEVTYIDDQARVHFPMGTCVMQVQGELMSFAAEAHDDAALEMVKQVIASHVVRYGELKDAKVVWHPAPSDSAT